MNRGLRSRRYDIIDGPTNDMLEPWGFLCLGLTTGMRRGVFHKHVLHVLCYMLNSAVLCHSPRLAMLYVRRLRKRGLVCMAPQCLLDVPTYALLLYLAHIIAAVEDQTQSRSVAMHTGT